MFNHWRHQLWGTGARAPLTYNNLFFPVYFDLYKAWQQLYVDSRPVKKPGNFCAPPGIKSRQHHCSVKALKVDHVSVLCVTADCNWYVTAEQTTEADISKYPLSHRKWDFLLDYWSSFSQDAIPDNTSKNSMRICQATVDHWNQSAIRHCHSSYQTHHSSSSHPDNQCYASYSAARCRFNRHCPCEPTLSSWPIGPPHRLGTDQNFSYIHLTSSISTDKTTAHQLTKWPIITKQGLAIFSVQHPTTSAEVSPSFSASGPPHDAKCM